jgi:hypothetical protein
LWMPIRCFTTELRPQPLASFHFGLLAVPFTLLFPFT